MKSFSRIVQLYSDAQGAGGDKLQRRRFAQWAQADLSDLFSRHNWRAFERNVDVYLWGTQALTLSSVSGNLVTFSETADEKWVGQDVVLGSSTVPHQIVRINNTNSFIIEPSYSGTAISSGDSATIRQCRLGLPTNFGRLLDYVKRDDIFSRPCAPSEITSAFRSGTGLNKMHCVHEKNLLIWPTGTERLTFRYSYLPSELYEYGEGTALVKSTETDWVIGSGTKWTYLPDDGNGAILEEDYNIQRGFATSATIVSVHDDTHLRIDDEWQGTFGSIFNYRISSAVDLPYYMDAWVQSKAEFRANKRDEAYVERQLLRAKSADNASDERIPAMSEFGHAIAYISMER